MGIGVFPGGIGTTTAVPFVRLQAVDGVRAYAQKDWETVSLIRRFFCWLFGDVKKVAIGSDVYMVVTKSFQRVARSADLSAKAMAHFLSNSNSKPHASTTKAEILWLGGQALTTSETGVTRQESIESAIDEGIIPWQMQPSVPAEIAAVESTFVPFRDMNQDTDGIISSFLDDTSVVRTVQVCKAWNANRALQNVLFGVQERAQYRRECYPNQLIQAFQKVNRSLARLPVLDLRDRIGNTGYIDFLGEEDMPFPVMRFKDRNSRVGIAIHIACDVDNEERKGVIAIFQRYKNIGDIWVSGGHSPRLTAWAVDSIAQEAHRGKHAGNEEEKCATCPTVLQNTVTIHKWVEELFTKKDFFFRRVGAIPQEPARLYSADPGGLDWSVSKNVKKAIPPDVSVGSLSDSEDESSSAEVA